MVWSFSSSMQAIKALASVREFAATAVLRWQCGRRLGDGLEAAVTPVLLGYNVALFAVARTTCSIQLQAEE